MRLLTLNLRHGGKRHMLSILAGLLGHGADVLVLTEYRNGPSGAVLRERLAEAGLRYQAASHGELRRNGVLIAARQAFRSAPQEPLCFDRARLLNVRFRGFYLLGLHMPNMKAKVPHWRALLRLADDHPRRRQIFAGDFNTGLNFADSQGMNFTCAVDMEALEGKGWADAWRHLHPKHREYSWVSHKGRGYRLDHAFLSPSLKSRLRGAVFDHSFRERGYSDHSALVVDLAL